MALSTVGNTPKGLLSLNRRQSLRSFRFRKGARRTQVGSRSIRNLKERNARAIAANIAKRRSRVGPRRARFDQRV